MITPATRPTTAPLTLIQIPSGTLQPELPLHTVPTAKLATNLMDRMVTRPPPSTARSNPNLFLSTTSLRKQHPWRPTLQPQWRLIRLSNTSLSRPLAAHYQLTIFSSMTLALTSCTRTLPLMHTPSTSTITSVATILRARLFSNITTQITCMLMSLVWSLSSIATLCTTWQNLLLTHNVSMRQHNFAEPMAIWLNTHHIRQAR
mmetsp:Transcript_7765/g.15418  ORF Transcript_7765/g.15418 Transcript_7765/m.15418 type:complete len:203 (-) Transcript_7765:495-1103(-)